MAREILLHERYFLTNDQSTHRMASTKIILRILSIIYILSCWSTHGHYVNFNSNIFSLLPQILMGNAEEVTISWNKYYLLNVGDVAIFKCAVDSNVSLLSYIDAPNGKPLIPIDEFTKSSLLPYDSTMNSENTGAELTVRTGMQHMEKLICSRTWRKYGKNASRKNRSIDLDYVQILAPFDCSGENKLNNKSDKTISENEGKRLAVIMCQVGSNKFSSKGQKKLSKVTLDVDNETGISSTITFQARNVAELEN